MSRPAIAATLLALAAAAGCGASSTSRPGPAPAPDPAGGASATRAATGPPQTTRSAPAAPRLADLHDIGQLRTRFNAHGGEPRLIILMSPT